MPATYQRDGSHDAALHGIDNGTLPEAVVLDDVLAETRNDLTTHADHDAADDCLEGIEENARFHIDLLTTDALATGKARFRQERLSFVDACSVAYLQTEGIGYLYALADDVDAVEEVCRLDTATNPHDPN